VNGNLATARATASKVAAALDNGLASPLGFQKIPPGEMVSSFLDYVKVVQGLAPRTHERYRAALERFQEFAESKGIASIDRVSVATVEDFVKWLRQKRRTRNGSKKGKTDAYKIAGVKFILSTARTAFNWAARRRHLPPFTNNPFGEFPIDKLQDRSEEDGPDLLSPTEQEAFFGACDEWQRPLFLMLAAYGPRVGELVHLLIDDVDLGEGAIQIRSKPFLFWHVKNDRERVLPLLPELEPVIKAAIGTRKAGFVFLNKDAATNPSSLALSFTRPRDFRAHAEKIADAARAATPDDEKAAPRAVRSFCRSMGQIPEKRIRTELMKLTKRIGRPDLTRAHDLRHLFTSRAQENDMNPILVQEILGHKSLEMTRRYTHLGLDAKRKALRRASGDLFGQRSSGT
jgi:integrase